MAFRGRTCRSGLTLTELMISIVAGAVLVLAGFAMWTLSYRLNLAARARAEASQTAFAVLHRIEQDVMRADQIKVPDPDHDHPNDASIRLRIDNSGTPVYRAFRLSAGQLVIDLKDGSNAPLALFEGISLMTFTVLDVPTNSRVQIDCTVTIKGQQAQMRSVVMKRN